MEFTKKKEFFWNQIPLLIIIVISNVIYLFSFYPGVLSSDSLSQWHQFSQLEITNWHPAYHTILMWLLTRLWYSPAGIAIFQIICFDIALIYASISFNKVKIPKLITYLVIILSSFNLINGLMVLTIWKDVLYSICILALTIIIFNLIQTDGEWINNKNNSIILGFILANIFLLRHNGFPVSLISFFVLFLVFKSYRKPFLFSGFVLLMYILFINVIIYNLFNVDEENTQSFAVAFIHPIAAHVNQGTNFTIEESDFLNKIFPLENSWPYSCYDATVLFYKGVNFAPVTENPIVTAKIFFKYTYLNPSVTINHFICLSSFTWQILQPENVYLETVLFDSINPNDYAQWKNYSKVTKSQPIFQKLNEKISDFGTFLQRVDKYKILWRPAIYLHVFLVAVLLISSKKKKYFLLSIPVISQTIIIMGTAQLQALRYQFPILLVSMIFTLPLFYMFTKFSDSSGDFQ